MKKTKLCAVFCTVVMFFSLLAAPVSAGNGTVITNQSSKTISVSFSDADVRDVLSAVGMEMGYSILFAGSPTRVSLDMKNVTPLAAFEYVIKLTGLDYLRDGSTLIVGTKADLVDDFARTLSITAFQLKYIQADVLNEKINQLGINVTVILMPTNNKALWVRGLASDIAKVNELIKILDITENSESSANTKTQLQTITMNYITAADFNEFIRGLGFNNGIAVENEGKTLWVYATLSEYDEIWKLRELVDVESGGLNVDATKDVRAITTTMMQKSDALSAVQTAYPELSVFSLSNSAKTFVVIGRKADVDGAYKMISKLDASLSTALGSSTSLEKIMFQYNTVNISASELGRRLEKVDFDGNMQWYIVDSSELSTNIYIYCSADYQADVMTLLHLLDSVSAANTFSSPVFRATDAAGAANAIAYIQGMLGAIVTDKLDVIVFDSEYVVYLKNSTAETAKLIEALLEKTRATDQTGGKSTAPDVSWATYVATQFGGDNALAEAAGTAAYAAWVQNKLKG